MKEPTIINNSFFDLLERYRYKQCSPLNEPDGAQFDIIRTVPWKRIMTPQRVRNKEMVQTRIRGSREFSADTINTPVVLGNKIPKAYGAGSGKSFKNKKGTTFGGNRIVRKATGHHFRNLFFQGTSASSTNKLVHDLLWDTKEALFERYREDLSDNTCKHSESTSCNSYNFPNKPGPTKIVTDQDNQFPQSRKMLIDVCGTFL